MRRVNEQVASSVPANNASESIDMNVAYERMFVDRECR